MRKLMAQWKTRTAHRKLMRLSPRERMQLLLGGTLLLLGLLCLIYVVVSSGSLVPQGSLPVNLRKS
jgi:uncharacterized membrane protein HdeD (DUF308 family)